MKKHLLALLSWSMLFLGTASFVSCDDDDDDNNDTKNENVDKKDQNQEEDKKDQNQEEDKKDQNQEEDKKDQNQNEDDTESKTTVANIYQKYSVKQGTVVDGDDVVYVLGNTVTLYHFSGEELKDATCYMDCLSAEKANKFAEEYGAKADGQYMYYELDDEDLEEYKGMKKADIVESLKAADEMFSFE